METTLQSASDQSDDRATMALLGFGTFGASIMTFLIATFLREGISATLAYAFWGIVNIGLCCLVASTYPKSALFLWFSCNILIFFGAVVDPNFWRSDLWIGCSEIVLLSVAGSVLGLVFSKKHAPPTAENR